MRLTKVMLRRKSAVHNNQAHGMLFYVVAVCWSLVIHTRTVHSIRRTWRACPTTPMWCPGIVSKRSNSLKNASKGGNSWCCFSSLALTSWGQFDRSSDSIHRTWFTVEIRSLRFFLWIIVCWDCKRLICLVFRGYIKFFISSSFFEFTYDGGYGCTVLALNILPNVYVVCSFYLRKSK